MIRELKDGMLFQSLENGVILKAQKSRGRWYLLRIDTNGRCPMLSYNEVLNYLHSRKFKVWEPGKISSLSQLRLDLQDMLELVDEMEKVQEERKKPELAVRLQIRIKYKQQRDHTLDERVDATIKDMDFQLAHISSEPAVIGYRTRVFESSWKEL